MASTGYTPGRLCSPAMNIGSLNQRGWLLLPLCRWQEVQGSSLPWGLAWSNRTMAPPHNSGGFRWFPPSPTCVGWYTATTGCAALDGWLCPLSFNFFICRVGGLLQHLHPGALKSQGVSRFHLLQEVIDPKLYHQSMHPQKEKKCCLLMVIHLKLPNSEKWNFYF